MKFNINDYKGKYVMHCKTEEEARDFCSYLHSIGKKWRGSNASYLDNSCYNAYGSETAYNFNSCLYCDIHYYNREGYTILEWSDFMKKEFTKADLKTGDVILRRNGDVEIFDNELGMFIKKDGWADIRALKDDLTSAYKDDAEWDIVAVRRPKYIFECQFNAFECKHGTLVYERKEVEEMTLAEVCRLLGKEIKIIK